MSWAWIGSGRLVMRTAATKAVLDDIRPSLMDGPGPSGAARGAVSEPRGAAREARSTAGLRIRPFRHAYNRTVAKRPSEVSESVVRKSSRLASSFTMIGRAFFASFALQFHPHMIRREVVTVMDVE